MRIYNKIFGIGYSRTGTTSLAAALNILGFNVKHFCTLKNGTYLWNDICRDTVDFDGIISSALSLVYKRLHIFFPNSKFILSIREEHTWKNSIQNYCQTYNYCNIINYEKQVRYYFKNTQNLLVINICEQNSEKNWKEICDFLDVKVPSVNFPHENSLGNTLCLK